LIDFEFTADQLAVKETMINFAQRELVAGTGERDKNNEFSRTAWQKCAEMGVMGMPFPEQFGGIGQDIITTTLAMEAMGYGAEDRGLLFSINAQMWSIQMPLLHFGSDDQKASYLPGLIDGSIIGAHGMSESSSGSDTFSMSTVAAKDGDYYVLNGSKTWTTNGPVCDMLVVFANIDKPAGGFMGITVFIVDKNAPGLTIGQPIEKMGLKTSPMSEVYFDNVRVHKSMRLGKERQGAKIFNHSMEWERACILGVVVGAMEKQMEGCVEYSKDRVQYNKRISSNQAISHKIVEMKLRHEISRLLLYKVAWLKQQGLDATQAAALAKLHISEAAVQTGLDAIQIHGGMGYVVDLGVERFLRDSIGGRIYSGTNEIQKNIIAHTMGL
jgi:alkylation response protein AidB-like acyl-CoA dehydrogenase